MTRLPAVALLALALASAGCRSSHECPSGESDCFGVCRDLQSSGDACGSCFRRCPDTASCQAGACVCNTAGLVPCGSACVDPASYATDPDNCGACGVACGFGTCAGSVCQCEGGELCAGALPRCAHTQSDQTNCGSCGNVCPLANDVCIFGVCQCPASLPDTCDDTCVSLQTDERHCVTCGTACASGATCTGAPTGCQCPGGESVCGAAPGACVDRSTDEQNCGACGHVCAAGATCASGSCSCPVATPLPCGAIGGNGGTCCAGTGCCGSACQTQHFNGVNASYFDCGALDQHTLDQARLAAISWSPTGTPFESGLACGSCLCRQSATQAAIWCYAGSPLKGLVAVTSSPNCLSAACPFGGNATAWH